MNLMDLTQNKNFMAQVQREVVKHLDVKITDTLISHMRSVAKKFLEDRDVVVGAVPTAGRPAGVTAVKEEEEEVWEYAPGGTSCFIGVTRASEGRK